MKKIINKYKYLILAGILILSFFLRFDNLYTWPRIGATFDEYAWTWLGINLIQHQMPESWSPHAAYKQYKLIVYQHTNFRLVKPYLEHPPLFGIVAGGFALLNGVSDMYHVDIYHIRALALLLGVASTLLVYLLVQKIYDVENALLASFIYNIMPTVAVGSRLVQNENFFIPGFLFALYLTATYLEKKQSRYRNIAAIVCGLLALAKVPWLTATFAIVGILLVGKRYKDIPKFLGIVVPIFMIFFVYGIYFDAKLFSTLWQLQLQRYDLMFNSFFAIFTDPLLTDRRYIDGWVFFGWFAMVLLCTKDYKKNVFVIMPFFAYFAVYLFAIPNEPGHGWYRYPFNPFFAIAITVFLKEYFVKNFFLTFMFLVFTGMSMLQNSWVYTFGFSFFVMRFFLVLFGLSALPGFFPFVRKPAAVVSYCSFVIVALLSIWSILSYTEQ